MESIPPAFLPLLANINVTVSDVFATKYITVVSLTLALYDGLNLMPHEIRYIWFAKNSITKWIYLVNRYVSFVGIALLVRATGGLDWGDLSDRYCVTIMGLDLILGALSIGVANYLVLLKVWFIWDQRRMVIAITTVAWLVSYTVTLALVGVSISHLIPNTYSFAKYGLNVCGTVAKPDVLRGIWAAPIALEVIVFIFTILNAAHRPRPANVSLMNALYRDGFLFFGALFVLRLFNLVIIITARTSSQFIGSCLIWGVNAALLHRLILNQSIKNDVDDDADKSDTSYEMDEKYDDRPPTPERYSFFDNDAFHSPRRPRKKVAFAPEVTFMDTAQQDRSLKVFFTDAWRTVEGVLDRAARSTV